MDALKEQQRKKLYDFAFDQIISITCNIICETLDEYLPHKLADKIRGEIITKLNKAKVELTQSDDEDTEDDIW